MRAKLESVSSGKELGAATIISLIGDILALAKK
jgi:hypothetical protein